MTKKIRTIFFFSLVVFFFFAATVAIFYAQGLRFDFKNFKVLKTGGISVKVSPVSSKIFLNQKLTGRTMPMSDYVFVQGLLPKSYDVRVEKDGYMPWSKTLEVEETKVTEAKNVVLFPQTISFNGEKNGVEKIYPLSNDKLVLQYQSSQTVPGRIFIYNLNSGEEIALVGINALLTDNDLSELKILGPQDLLFLLKNKKSGKTSYFLSDLQTQSPTAQELDFIGGGASNIFLANSFGDRIVFWQENGYIFKRSLGSDEIPQKFFAQTISTFAVSGGYFYMLSEDGKLSRIDQNKNFPIQELTDQPFEIKKNEVLELSVFTGRVFLKASGDLYVMDEKERSFQKIFEGIKNLKISPFEDKLLCQLQNELWVYTLKDTDTPSPEKTGTKIFISRFSQPVQKSDWIDDNYLTFSIADKINIIETDTRSNINMYEIAGFGSSDIWFDQKNKDLYVLSSSTLLVSDKLLSK